MTDAVRKKLEEAARKRWEARRPKPSERSSGDTEASSDAGSTPAAPSHALTVIDGHAEIANTVLAARTEIILPPVDFADLPAFTRACVAQVDGHLVAAAGFAVLTGLGLLMLKEERDETRGRKRKNDNDVVFYWTDYVQNEIGLHVKKAERMMRLARGYLAKRAGLDPHAWLALPAPEREKIIAQVPQLTAGQTQLDLFRELFNAAPTSNTGGGDGPPTKDQRKVPTIEEQVARLKERCNECAGTLRYAVQDGCFEVLNEGELDGWIDELEAALTAAQKWRDTPKKERRPSHLRDTTQAEASAK
ncbi:MAG: hypothetical protein JO295_03610 [Verrucomicrobia bacterium]|nr:hypothetical protein [Verrucomicrobiota bacterium]